MIETRQHRTTCPRCQTLNSGVLPEGLEAERFFGPNLEATVIFYKQTQHLSYERTVETMRTLHGVILSEGAIASIPQRAGEKAQPVAEVIKEQVIVGEMIRSDESRVRVKAGNLWQWVFLSENAVYHTIVPTRSATEITELMGPLAAKAWGSDCFSVQLKAPAEVFQLCLAHQLRGLATSAGRDRARVVAASCTKAVSRSHPFAKPIRFRGNEVDGLSAPGDADRKSTGPSVARNGFTIYQNMRYVLLPQ